MLTVRLADMSHTDRPSITFTAEELFVERNVTVFHGCKLISRTWHDYNCQPASIQGVAYSIDAIADEPLTVGRLDWQFTVS